MEPKLFCKDVIMSFDSDTIVELDKNNEITFGVTCESGKYTFVVKDIRGDAVIKWISYIYMDDERVEINTWNKETKQFFCYDSYNNNGFEIHYVAVPEKVDYQEIIYHLQFSSNLIKALNLCEFHERKIVLPGYENLPLKYTVFKNQEGYGKLCIKNEHDCFIQGMKYDFYYEVNENDGIEMDISFILNLSLLTEKNQIPAITESRPESTDSLIPKQCISKMYEKSNCKYYGVIDVILISSDNILIPSHRNLLAKSSSIFDQICDVKETPLKIIIKDFNAETIKAALEFLDGKPESIKGKEIDVFQLAKNYEIQDLIESCCSHFIESINPSNVCQFVEIAYSNNFEELKQKCKEIMVAQKSEIDYGKLQALPKDILLSVFCC